MKVLQEAVEQVLQALPKEFLAALIAKKLRKQGIKLTKRERELLTKQLAVGNSGMFRLRRGG